MLMRLVSGVAVFGIGFLIGREVGKMDPIVDEMRRMLHEDDAEGRVIEGAAYRVEKPAGGVAASEGPKAGH